MNIPLDSSLIFFSDLDGTLLDHETYSFEPAQPALAHLRDHHIPLILTSSKTAAEIEPLRHAMGFDHCEAIVENGAGLLSSNQTETCVHNAYPVLLEKLAEIPAIYRDHFTGFSHWSAEEISKQTGLTIKAAHLAKDRQFSEPGLWSGSNDDLGIFCDMLEGHGIIAQKGGRFLTLSFGGKKSDRMSEIAHKQRKTTAHLFCVALGDAPNDIAMLEAADLGIIIPNTSHKGIDELAGEANGQIIRARFSGPKGWNATVLNVLRQAGII